jgi:hypothetical protein
VPIEVRVEEFRRKNFRPTSLTNRSIIGAVLATDLSIFGRVWSFHLSLSVVHLPLVSSYTAIDMPAVKNFLLHDKTAILRANSIGHKYLQSGRMQPNVAMNVHH